jgi:hypothetical protein
MVQDLGYRVRDLEFRAWGLGFRIQDLGFRSQWSLGGDVIFTPGTVV